MNLSDKVSPQLNLNMKTKELEINDLHIVKTEEEMEFYPGHQKDLVQLKEEPLDVINDDIPKDPLAIEETNLVKSENLKVENDEESEISLNNEVSTPFNFNMKTNELQINDKHLHTVNTEEQIRFDPGHVTIDEEIIKGSTKKNYVCNFCQKIFNCYSNLKVHINLHTKEKNYICNICQKSYFQKSALKLHLITHTKRKIIIVIFVISHFIKVLL
ncbi:uncharacterized protein LOC142328414 isoform X1 [Lycorma delicatula]|uniref:uncharacterized protein LOC142328414 isoform X1 n=1 Tax=Lycorma delicatula TaxID=130591 RepID=UPI003F510A7A